MDLIENKDVTHTCNKFFILMFLLHFDWIVKNQQNGFFDSEYERLDK